MLVSNEENQKDYRFKIIFVWTIKHKTEMAESNSNIVVIDDDSDENIVAKTANIKK